MGGNALSVTTSRLSKDAYKIVCENIVGRLATAIPGHRTAVIQAYAQKPDFGDLDLLIEGGVPIHIPSANAQTLGKLFSQAFEHEQNWPARDKFELLKSSEGVVTHRLTWAQREKLRNESRP